MSSVVLNPDTVCRPVGPYSQAVLSKGPSEIMHIAGQVGLNAQGELLPDFAGQCEQAWTNIIDILHSAGMNIHNVVKVTTYVTDESMLPLLGPIREKFLGTARPAATLIIVKALARKDWLVEVEATAIKH